MKVLEEGLTLSLACFELIHPITINQGYSSLSLACFEPGYFWGADWRKYTLSLACFERDGSGHGLRFETVLLVLLVLNSSAWTRCSLSYWPLSLACFELCPAGL